jgi:hypothetical protein
MRMVLIVIATSKDSALQVNDAAVTDALWAAALPQYSIEHISVKVRPREIAVGVFATTMDDALLRRIARDMVKRACAMSPLLREATVHASTTIPIPEIINRATERS